MEAKKAFHEQESSEPFNPQDHILSSVQDVSDDKPQLSPSEPCLPDGPLIASFGDGRPSVKVSISFNKIQPSTLVATFNNGRPPMNVSITFDSTSRSSANTSMMMSGSTLSDALEATEQEVNISEKLKELRGKMQLRLKPAQMENAPKVLDVTSNIIRIADGFTSANLSEDQQMLVGYNQSAEPPSSVYDQPDTHHPVNVEYTLCTDTLKKVFKDANLKTLDGEDILSILNLWSFPYAIDPTTGQIVMNLMHYETEQEHISLNGKHAFRARHSTGELISTTPAFICANLGNCYFLQTINGDVIPFAFKKDTKPTDKVSEETYSFMMKAYIHYLVRPAADDKRIVIAIGSKATCKTFAKFAYGGLSQLLAVYDIDPTLWISASPDKLEVNNHCEALYNILYCIYMHLKAKTNDAFATNTRRVIDPNAEPCTFAMEYFEEGSDIFELIQRNHKALCSLGGTNCCKKRDESVLTYLLLLEEKVMPKDALEYIKDAFSVENRNLVVGWMKFCKMNELAGRLHRQEEIDTDDVNEFASLVGMKVVDLMKNAEACMEGQGKSNAKFTAMSQLAAQSSDNIDMDEVNDMASLVGMKVVDLIKNAEACRKGAAKFTIMAQLSAMLERGNVDEDVVVEMASRCDMKKDDLRKGAEAIKKGQHNAQATIVSKGEVFWEKMFEELVEYKKQNGDCKVPARYAANKELGTWVQNQRTKLYKKEEKSETDIERIIKLDDIGFARKGEVEKNYRGMLLYSDSSVPSRMNPIEVKCGSCNKTEMTTHVVLDNGGGSKTFKPGIYKHVLPSCGKSGKCRHAHLVPVDEGHSFNSRYPQEATCIKYATVTERFKPGNMKTDKTKETLAKKKKTLDFDFLNSATYPHCPYVKGSRAPSECKRHAEGRSGSKSGGCCSRNGCSGCVWWLEEDSCQENEES